MPSHKPPAQIRGISALLGDEDIGNPNEISLAQINLPNVQPRRYFDSEKLKQLIASIRDKGIIEPLLVRPVQGNRYELVAGERRYRAAQELGLSTVPVTVKDLDDSEALEVALIENLQREDLNPVEETEGVLHLLSLKFNLTIADIKSLLHRLVNEYQQKVKPSEVTSNVTGKDEIEAILEPLGIKWLSFATNRLPLLNLPKDLLEALRQGEIEYTKAKAISRIKNEKQRQDLLRKAVSENLSLADIREICASTKPKSVEADLVRDKITETLRLARHKEKQLDSQKQKKLLKYLDQIRALLES